MFKLHIIFNWDSITTFEIKKKKKHNLDVNFYVIFPSPRPFPQPKATSTCFPNFVKPLAYTSTKVKVYQDLLHHVTLCIFQRRYLHFPIKHCNKLQYSLGHITLLYVCTEKNTIFCPLRARTGYVHSYL